MSMEASVGRPTGNWQKLSSKVQVSSKRSNCLLAASLNPTGHGKHLKEKTCLQIAVTIN